MTQSKIVISFALTLTSNTRINTVQAMKGVVIIFTCSLLVGVNSLAVFKNGECFNPDPWRISRANPLSQAILFSNQVLAQLRDQLANITIRVEAFELKPNSEDKAVLVLQLALATKLDTNLKMAKCLAIDDVLRESNLEEKYKVIFADIAARTEFLRQQLNSLTARVNAIEV